jgi:acetyl-CoA carboxylase beta subunit
MRQTTQWAKEKAQKDKQRSTKHSHHTYYKSNYNETPTENEPEIFIVVSKLQSHIRMTNDRKLQCKVDGQHNGQKKKHRRTNNDLQNTTQKTKDRVTRTPLKTGVY